MIDRLAAPYRGDPHRIPRRLRELELARLELARLLRITRARRVRTLLTGSVDPPGARHARDEAEGGDGSGGTSSETGRRIARRRRVRHRLALGATQAPKTTRRRIAGRQSVVSIRVSASPRNTEKKDPKRVVRWEKWVSDMWQIWVSDMWQIWRV